jgi:ABC-2 type transport system ATP-binding protein
MKKNREDPVVRILDLHKTYRGASHPSVDGLSLHIGRGAFFGLLGPNGAGKTTILSILCGLRSYDRGEVTIYGLDIKRHMPQIKPLIGVVPQDIALYPELTVDENLRFFGGMYQLSAKKLSGRSIKEAERPGEIPDECPDERLPERVGGCPGGRLDERPDEPGNRQEKLNDRIDAYLADFGLTFHRRKKTGCLSGGMKRQVNLIAALLHRPSLLFLDEPTVGVDVHSRQAIIENLKNLHNNGMTVIYTSHDMKEAESLCTDVALINHGRVVCEGVPCELTDREAALSLEDLFIKKTLS